MRIYLLFLLSFFVSLINPNQVKAQERTSFTTQKVIQGVANFEVPFTDGLNTLEAVSNDNDINLTDKLVIDFRLISQNLKSNALPFKELNVSLGDFRFFNDPLTHQIWFPEQEYKPGSWGYIGGKVFSMKDIKRQSYGSDKNILGSDLDPVYETQRVGIHQFRFDVPDGDYALTLHFAELLSAEKKEDLVYNLVGNSQVDKFEKRVFKVKINGQETLRLTNQKDLLSEQAYASKIKVTTKNGLGITIDFEAIDAEPILNGIQLRKVR